MKKLLVALLAMLLLVGCGQTATPDTEEIPELIYYNIGTPSKDNDVVNEAINEYLTDQEAGFTIDMTYLDWGEYEQKMQVINNSGEYYDLAFTAAWAGPYLTLASKGAFYDIEDIIVEHAPETLKQLGGIEALDVVRVDGKVNAIPSALKAINLMFMFDKDLVDKYDVPYEDIKTLDDLRPWFEKLKDLEPDYDMFQIGQDVSIPGMYDDIIFPVGVHYEDETLTAVNAYETDEKIHNLNVMHEYYSKGFINQDAAISKELKEKPFFVNIADGGPSAAAIWSNMYKQNIVTTQIFDEPYATTAATHGSMMAVSSGSKYPEQSVKFIEMMNTDAKLQNLLSFGVEGVHYNFNDNGQVVYTEKMDDFQATHFTLGTGVVRALTEADELDIKEREKAYQESLQHSALLGFTFDPSNVQTEVSNLQNVRDEFVSSLATGSVDPAEYLPKMNEKLQAAGVQTVIDEVQKQINEWIKQ